MKTLNGQTSDRFLNRNFYLLSVLIGSIISLCFFLNVFVPFFIVFILVYFWLLLKHPEISLLIVIVVILDAFSLINEDMLSIPNIFKIRDIFYLSSFFPLVTGIYRKDKKIKYVFLNPIGRMIYIIIFLSILQIFITKLKFPGESFNSIIKVARIYLYYLIFFPLLYVLLDRKRLNRFLASGIFIISIFCFLFIIQVILGPYNKIFFWGRVETQLLQGFSITRIYVAGERIPSFLLLICFMIFLFCKKYKNQFKNTFLMILSALQTILTSGRAHIFGVITGAVFSMFFLMRRKKTRAILKIFIVILLVVLIFEFSSKVFMPGKDNFLRYISTRIASTYDAVIQKEDTFYVRMRDSAGRMELIKRYPIFGLGFVHDESPLFAFERGEIGNAIRTSDSGIIVLLLDFGIIGLIWLLTLSIIFLIRAKNIFKIADDHITKSIILGTVAYYSSRLFSFITLADFVLYEGIIIITICFVLIESLHYFYNDDERKTTIYNHS